MLQTEKKSTTYTPGDTIPYITHCKLSRSGTPVTHSLALKRAKLVIANRFSGSCTFSERGIYTIRHLFSMSQVGVCIIVYIT